MAGIALIAQIHRDSQVSEQWLHRLAASSWQRNVMGEQFGAGHDAGDAERRAPHRLGTVEGWILEGREANEPVDKGRRQSGAWNVEPVAENRVDTLRQRCGDPGQLPAPRRRRGPGFLVLVVNRQAQADDTALPAGFVGNRRRLRQGQAAKRREKRPLVRPGFETLVEKEAVAAISRAVRKGQRDEVAEAAGWQGILAREKSVVGLEPNVGVALHGLGQEMGAETARKGGRHRLCEEGPDMPAIARTRPFQGRRNPLRLAGGEKGLGIPPPCPLVEVGREKPAGVVGKHGIDADRVASSQVSVDHLVRHRQEGLIRASAALDPGFFAQARHPFVAARRRVARLARPGVLPAFGKDILAPAKEGSEQRDLLVPRRAARHRTGEPQILPFCPPRALKVGKPSLKNGLLAPESRKPLANECGLLAVGCSVHPPRRHRCIRSADRPARAGGRAGFAVTFRSVCERHRATHVAQPADSASACSSTVRVADSCLSGG